jgi:hypothetical protein
MKYSGLEDMGRKDGWKQLYGLKISYGFIYKRNKSIIFFRAGKCYSLI